MRRRSSSQTRELLAALAGDPTRWRHGYDLSRETGLASGTLYPILARLEARGLLEARWEQRRHVYRLTGDGVRFARAELTDVPAAGRAREAW
ncbi:MAG TPA: helix-turn-helix transcriptional regulator [Gaiellaceae bacterium]|nr:helix-turn-helix transcriptional regulator [Gaiellaceae bacterium]